MTQTTNDSRLRVIIDGSMARGGGGFTYLVNVIPALVKMAPHHDFLLVSSNAHIEESLPEAPNLEILHEAAGGFGRRVRSILWDGPNLAARWNADLYFSVAEYAPLRAACAVIAAFRNRTVFTPVDRGWPLKTRLRLAIIRSLAAATAKASDRIMFVSQDSADFIGSELSIPEAKHRVVYHGIDRKAWSKHGEKPTNVAQYILSVSSIYRYKNYVPLIQGWAELSLRRPETPDLIIIGDDQDSEYSKEMARAREATGALSSRIHILGELPYADMVSWYAHSCLFVFPSYLETFGHPLLEAMASGTPLVAADIPVFREIAGDAALYASALDPGEFAVQIERALYEEDTRAQLSKAGRERVEIFSWNRTAEKLLDLFEETATPRADSR